MGRSIALTLAREGAKVIVNYRTGQQNAETIAGHITRRGGSALAVNAAIFCPSGCEELVDAAIQGFGRVDICIVGPGCGWHPEPPDRLLARRARRT